MKIQVLILCSLITLSAAAQKRDIDVNPFSEISLGINATLHLTQGNDEKVTIDCSDSDFEKIEFDQSSDRLTIRSKDRRGWKGNNLNNVTIYVTMREISRVALSGAGSVKGKNTFKTGDLDIIMSGSGYADLNLDSEDVEIKISGSGKIDLEGKANEAAVRISGSGKVKAEDLEVSVFEASISGSGDCYITATEAIEANISGSGNIYYSGNPSRVQANSSGSGKVKKI